MSSEHNKDFWWTVGMASLGVIAIIIYVMICLMTKHSVVFNGS